MKIALFCSALSLLVMVDSRPALAQNGNSQNDDSFFHSAATIVNQVKAFDKMASPKNTHLYMILYDSDPSQKVRVTVTTIHEVVRKLTYSGYDESMTTSDKEAYYFDTTGKLRCHINRSTGILSYDVYIDTTLVLFTQPDDPTNQVMKGSDVLFQLAADKYIVDYYLGAAGYSNYSTFTLSQRNRFPLRLLKASHLYSSPSVGSSTIETLKKGTQVYYLDRSAHLDSPASRGKWVWYKVGTTSGHVGWIWGYPTGVAEKRDE